MPWPGSMSSSSFATGPQLANMGAAQARRQATPVKGLWVNSHTCVYCERAGPFSDEHVLARALAGSGDNWVLKDLVCARCNKLFSTFERAWISSPGIAEARIHWGPSGRPRKGQAYQAHPSESIFLISDDDPIAYEVDILRGFSHRLRAQAVQTESGALCRAGDEADAKRLTNALEAFRADPRITLMKRASNRFRIGVLSCDDRYRFSSLEWSDKPANAWLDQFPLGGAVTTHPRMSVDAFGRLRFRCLKLREVTTLLNDLMRGRNAPYSGRGRFEAERHRLLIAQSTYDVGKVHRAIAKTLVNYAIATFGGDTIRSTSYQQIRDYCIGRRGDAPGRPFVG